LTIVVIAHRLGTIQSAENLLFVEDNNSVLPGKKGTEEYNVLMNRLLSINYAHQKQTVAVDKED